MKVKTIVFWTLWVGNSFTLQSVSGEDLEPGSASLFPGELDDDVVFLCQTLDSAAPQQEKVQLITTATSWSA